MKTTTMSTPTSTSIRRRARNEIGSHMYQTTTSALEPCLASLSVKEGDSNNVTSTAVVNSHKFLGEPEILRVDDRTSKKIMIPFTSISSVETVVTPMNSTPPPSSVQDDFIIAMSTRRRKLKHTHTVPNVNGSVSIYQFDDDSFTVNKYDNFTYTTSVSIRVTPFHNYYVSWGILFACYTLVLLYGLYQIYIDYFQRRLYKNYFRKKNTTNHDVITFGTLAYDDDENVAVYYGSVTTSTATTTTRNNSRTDIRRIQANSIRSNNFGSSGNMRSYATNNNRFGSTGQLRGSNSMDVIHQTESNTDDNNLMGGSGEESPKSPADETRLVFRHLLLAGLLLRIICIPTQIWCDIQWFQFVCDTIPEIIFASAWTLMVVFFVQLVSIATGTGTDTSPGIVIQMTTYVVYFVLIIVQLFNSVATILLYALLCCIYSALLGIVLYFGPKLILLLHPGFFRRFIPSKLLVTNEDDEDGTGGTNNLDANANNNKQMATRVSVCTFLCVTLFAARTIGYAWIVVMPPKEVYWWWNYGALELLPAFLFLLLMHPKRDTVTKVGTESETMSPPLPPQQQHGVGGSGRNNLGIRRNDSGTLRRADSNTSNTPPSIQPLLASGMIVPGASSSSNSNTPNSTGSKHLLPYNPQQSTHMQEISSLLKTGNFIVSGGAGYGSATAGAAISSATLISGFGNSTTTGNNSGPTLLQVSNHINDTSSSLLLPGQKEQK